tara:strand:+ start:958 stop:1119 length:162 start_codon:yes stop_codon:yes gene_type:complete
MKWIGQQIYNKIVRFTSKVFFGEHVSMANLPTSDPGVAGRLWNDSGTLKVSSG